MKGTLNNKRPYHSVLYYSGIILIAAVTVLYLWDGINTVQHRMIGYDEGYNATVAANLVRHGTYSVSYPSDIVFYNLITTGPTVILPTAALYKLFGITFFTSGIIPVIYMTLSIVILWLLFSSCYSKRAGGSLVAAVLTGFLVISNDLLLDVSTRLLGETACLFFLLGACLLYSNGCYYKRSLFFFLSGVFVVASFLTKSTMIFILVSLVGLVFIERVFNHISTGNVLCFYCGIVSGFLFLELYKIIQLGKISYWISWWGYEWNNMLAQSGETIEKPSVIEKIIHLSDIFEMNVLGAVLTLLLPIILYILLLIAKNKIIHLEVHSTVYAIILWGIAGSSLGVYFTLFGGSGLMVVRRHLVNVVFVKIVLLMSVGWLFLFGIGIIQKNKKRSIVIFVSLVLLIAVSFPTANIGMSVKGFIEKKTADDYDKLCFKEFVSEIEDLGNNANLLTYGWWQEPDLTLFLDRHMTDIRSVDINSLDLNNSYFIVGRRLDDYSIKEVETEFNIRLKRNNRIIVDYDKLSSFGSNELFSIYSISG